MDGPHLLKAFVSADLEDLRTLDDTTVNEILSIHLTGTRRIQLSIPTPPAGGTSDIPSEITTTYDFFISKEDYYLVRYATETNTYSSYTHVVWDFYDHNEPITIDFPELGVN